jgi:hypothetical protein
VSLEIHSTDPEEDTQPVRRDHVSDLCLVRASHHLWEGETLVMWHSRLLMRYIGSSVIICLGTICMKSLSTKKKKKRIMNPLFSMHGKR